MTDTDTGEHEHTPTAVPSVQSFYPQTLMARPYWVNWVRAYPYDDDADERGVIDYEAEPTKQPTAPYQDGNSDANPVLWNGGLSDEQFPATDYETVERWAGTSIPGELPADDRVISDTVRAGIIIPTPERREGYPGEDPDARPIVFLDWDDVRDPDTGEIHPVAANALRTLDGYAEISQSGTGIHQYVFGEIPSGRRKFMRHIDDTPFAGEDLPQIEIYSSGRVCGLTGRHVEGTGEDVVEGQDLLDNLVWQFGAGSNNAEGTPTDPFAHKRGDATHADLDDHGHDTAADNATNADGGTVTPTPAPATDEAIEATPDHETVGDALDEAASFSGEDPDEWDIPGDRTLGYEAVLRARERSDELATTANWELIGFAAGLGHGIGLSKEEILDDLEDHPTPQYGFDRSRAEKEVGSVYRKAEHGNYHPPNRNTLARRGILPDEYGSGDDDSEDSDTDPRSAETTLTATDTPEVGVFASEGVEPVVDDDDRVHLLGVSDDGQEVTKVGLGEVRCLGCGTTVGEAITCGSNPMNVPDKCPACEQSGAWKSLAEDVLDVEDLPLGMYSDPPWYVPSTASDERYGELWDDVRQYLVDHWDAGDVDAPIYDGLTAFAISTWLRPELTFVPHLMLMGRFTGGKTRLLNTLSRVSYRAVVTASATPASMFRSIDAHDVSYFVSEYHGLDPDTRRELDAVVRAAQKRGEKISRADQNAGGGYDPVYFDPFTHAAIATQYQPSDDIVSRCIQVHSSPPSRDMPAVHDEDEAREIRNRLLYARLRLLDSEEFADAERRAYGYLAQRDIDGRLREKLLAAVTIAHLWDRVDDIEPFVDLLEAETGDAESNSADAQFIAAVRDLAFEEIGGSVYEEDVDPFDGLEIPLGEVVDRYNTMTGQDRSSSWGGHVRKRLGLDTSSKRDGTVIDDLRAKLQQLCDDYNLEWESLDVHDPVRELGDTHRAQCSECGELETMYFEHAVEGYHMCRDCGEELRAAHDA